jgi:DNA-binding NarL/FixJ family response regulator
MSGSALIIDDHPLYRDALTQLLRNLLGDACIKAANSEVTVKMHVSSIFRVLNVANRTQATQAARKLMLLAETASSP